MKKCFNASCNNEVQYFQSVCDKCMQKYINASENDYLKDESEFQEEGD